MADQGTIKFVEPMVIEGTGGEFHINGSVNLLTGTLDNEMVVTLPVSSSLPWYAAYLGFVNPLAAGAVLVGERIFRNQIEKFSSAKYKVSGTLQESRKWISSRYSRRRWTSRPYSRRDCAMADGAPAASMRRRPAQHWRQCRPSVAAKQSDDKAAET